MAETPQLPERIQRELEEALRQGGVDKLPNRSRRQRRSFRLGMLDPRPRGPSDLVLIGVGIFLLGFVLRIPGIWLQLTFLGIGCVVLAVVTHLIQPQGYSQKFWRGRYLDIPTGRWQERLYRLIYRTKKEP